MTDYFDNTPHVEIQWATRINHSDGSCSYLNRADRDDCEEDLSDFRRGCVEIVSREVKYGEWTVRDKN